MMEENDEMRGKLGLDKRRMREERDGQRVKTQTDRALNIVLRREIDRLEDERLDLKMQMRKLSQRLGQRYLLLLSLPTNMLPLYCIISLSHSP